MTIAAERWKQMMAWLQGHDGSVDGGVPYELFYELMEEYIKDQKRVRVGVATLVRKGSAVLVGRRKGGRGHGTWALPGGHLEYQEDITQCVAREVMEETGLEVVDIRQGPYVNNYAFAEDDRHYITLFTTCELAHFDAEPKVMEPDKCFEWRWCYRNEVPHPIFPPLENYLKQHAPFNKWWP